MENLHENWKFCFDTHLSFQTHPSFMKITSAKWKHKFQQHTTLDKWIFRFIRQSYRQILFTCYICHIYSMSLIFCWSLANSFQCTMAYSRNRYNCTIAWMEWKHFEFHFFFLCLLLCSANELHDFHFHILLKAYRLLFEPNEMKTD